MTPHLDSPMKPLRYFSLRSYMGPPPSNAPALILCALALGTIVGLFFDLGAF